MAYKGTYKPKNIQKYKGDPSKITYRSLWERAVMKWLDTNDDCLEWASEEIAIQYHNPIKGKTSNYFPDFWIRFKSGVRLIEVKPKKETVRPPTPQRKTQKYINEMATFAVNQEKWKAAKQSCKKNNIRFEVWDEDVLDSFGIMKKNIYSRKPKTPQIKRSESNKSRLKPVRRAKRKS